MTAFTQSTQRLLSKLFFVKQLKAMQDFFHLAREHATSLTGQCGWTLCTVAVSFIMSWGRRVLQLRSVRLGHRFDLWTIVDTLLISGGLAGPCYDDDQLAKPIKHFTAEYVRKHVSTAVTVTAIQVPVVSLHQPVSIVLVC